MTVELNERLVNDKHLSEKAMVKRTISLEEELVVASETDVVTGSFYLLRRKSWRFRYGWIR